MNRTLKAIMEGLPVNIGESTLAYLKAKLYPLQVEESGFDYKIISGTPDKQYGVLLTRDAIIAIEGGATDLIKFASKQIERAIMRDMMEQRYADAIEQDTLLEGGEVLIVDTAVPIGRKFLTIRPEEYRELLATREIYHRGHARGMR